MAKKNFQPRPFAQIIRTERESLRLRCEEIAEQCAIDPTYYSKLENAHRRPPERPLVLRIAGALGFREHSGAWLELLAAAEWDRYRDDKSVQPGQLLDLRRFGDLCRRLGSANLARSQGVTMSPAPGGQLADLRPVHRPHAPASPRVLRLKLDSPEYKATFKGAHENPSRHAEDPLQAIAMTIEEIKKHGVRRIMIEDEDEIIHDIYVGDVEVPPQISTGRSSGAQPARQARSRGKFSESFPY